MSHVQMCTFMVDDLLFGVDVTQVQEVLRFQNMTRVPLAPRMVHGLINLRGQIVTAIDLRTRLGLGARENGALPMNVVLSGVEGPVSLLVDTIGDVIEVPDSVFESPPSTMLAAHREMICAICKLPQHLLLVLDPERITSFAETTSVPARRQGASR